MSVRRPRTFVAVAELARLACPDCGGRLLRCEGAVSEPVVHSHRPDVFYRVRPAVFLACSACEHCEEPGDRA